MSFLNDMFKSKGSNEAAEALNQIKAVHKSQAVIEFELDGTIITANDNFLSVLGYTLPEIQGKHHSMFAEPSFRESLEYRKFWDALGRGEFQAGEYLRIGKGGKIVWIQASYNPIFNEEGKAYKVVKFASDITEQKLKSIEEQSRYKQIIDNMPINMVLADTNGTIVTANPQTIKTLKTLEQYLPIKAEQLIGQSFDIFHKVPSHQRRIISDPKNLPHTAVIDVGPEKLDLLVSALYSSEGKYIGPMLTWSVVTAQVKAKEREEQVKRELEVTIKTLVDSCTNLDQNSGSLSSTMDQIRGVVEEVANYINSVSVATEEMIASISEISANTDRAATMTKDAVNEISLTEEIIRSLEQRSEEIAGILKVVTEIANQTNLLALNATIEAARAGEAGKGFAVVANEVKELANRTGEATGDIGNRIQAIQKETAKALSSIQTAVTSVRNINEVAVTIAGSVEEQTAVTSEIGKSMQNSTEKVKEMSDNVISIDGLVSNNSERTRDLGSVTTKLKQLSGAA